MAELRNCSPFGLTLMHEWINLIYKLVTHHMQLSECNVDGKLCTLLFCTHRKQFLSSNLYDVTNSSYKNHNWEKANFCPHNTIDDFITSINGKNSCNIKAHCKNQYEIMDSSNYLVKEPFTFHSFLFSNE